MDGVTLPVAKGPPMSASVVYHMRRPCAEHLCVHCCRVRHVLALATHSHKASVLPMQALCVCEGSS